MTTLKTVLGINVAIFSIIALFHLLRLVFQWPVQFAGWNVPLWLNVVFLVLAGVLVYLNRKHLRHKNDL